MMILKVEEKKFIKNLDYFLKKHIQSWGAGRFRADKKLKSAVCYSLFSDGKRFRPLLVLGTAKLLSIKTSAVLSLAGAIEILHTASLIHDDLPCMDNALARRGRAACHRLFGESLGLLAGDVLWVEAFSLTAVNPEWTRILARLAGFQGLMSGQALDLSAQLSGKVFSKKYYKEMNQRKTGSLISACIEGVLALKKDQKSNQAENLKSYARLMGEAFQTADDLQDMFNQKSAFSPTRKKALSELKQLSHEALSALRNAGADSSHLLSRLIVFNQKRCDI